MFEIFGALFGGAYLAGKAAGDKSAHWDAERKTQQRRYIISQITDFDTEREIRKEMFYHNPPEVACGAEELTMEKFLSIKQQVLDYRHMIMTEKIGNEDMAYVFGEDWRNSAGFLVDDFDSIRDIQCFSDRFLTLWEVVFNIYLSTLGLVETHHASHGYHYTMDIQYIPHDDRKEVARRACEVIARNVKANHPDIDGLSLAVGDGSGEKPWMLQWEFNKRV